MAHAAMCGGHGCANAALQLMHTDTTLFCIVDIVRAVENVVKATTDYAEQLAFEARKISTYMKTVDAVGISARVRQILAIVEDIEGRIQSLIRYSWLVEREWNVYVMPPAPSAEMSRKGTRSGIFPLVHLRCLDIWHVELMSAITRTRERLADPDYNHQRSRGDSVQHWDATGIVYSPNPIHWSAEYVLEKARGERAKKRPADVWLDAVPQIAHTRPGHKLCTQSTDIRRRNPLHYAALNAADLLWLKRLNYLDLQDIRQQHVAVRLPSLAAMDLFGDTPLSIGARCGNVGAVRYIVDESGVDATSGSLVDAALAASAEGQLECLSPIVSRLVAYPEGVALALSMAAFYGFDRLFEAICVAQLSSESVEDVHAELAKIAQRTGKSTVFHLSVLNGKTEMVKCAYHQQVFGSTAFDAHAKDDAQLTPLDAANFFGHRACADVLLTTYPELHPPLATELEPADAALIGDVLSQAQKLRSTPPDTYAVLVSVGATDLRQLERAPPLVLNTEAVHTMLDDMGLPRSTHLLLRIDSEEGVDINNARGWVTDVTSLVNNPSMAAYTWIPPAHFHTVHPERFVLKLDLLALVDQALLPSASEYKIIAQAALALPQTYVPKSSERMPGRYAPVCASGASYLHAAFISSASSDVVAEANLEVVVATPYTPKQWESQVPLSSSVSSTLASLSLSPVSNTSCASDGSTLVNGGSSINESQPATAVMEWRKPGETLVYGHRGSGMNFAPIVTPRRLQLGENTVLSMQKAIRDGACAVEFDVQVTRDLVPVVYHDWIVAETNLDIPVSALTLKQFMACNPCNSQPKLTRSRSRDCLKPDGANAIVAGHECRPIHVANSENTVQAPFATLENLFEQLPESVGFDIEVKYPMPDEADEFGVCSIFEINLFVDKILDVVYKYVPPPSPAPRPKQRPVSMSRTSSTSVQPHQHSAAATTNGGSADARGSRRPIVFTSFHPDICLLLAHKVNGDIPVMLLTDAGMSAMADCRCNSIEAAVRLCKWANLAGLVTHVGPISQSPRVASVVRRNGLAIATYGSLNNQAAHVKQQQVYGVDIVIVDDVRTARLTVG
ncbi:Glycerophosphocholine phosphodiesterase [Coemansia spiralis]|uniref:Glycerophosphocholine phosphodiesterase n=1 Tax=Coemansia spiralis TaxID=417178 RepID=A0A9W8GGS7_9FUNG|nr:Glycerophosphocholine phosphodiesterase [Coemansia spiralis]